MNYAPTPAPREEYEIPKAFEGLTSEVEMVREATNALIGRLKPVTSNIEPEHTTATCVAVKEPRTPMGVQVHELAFALGQVRAALNDAIRRLEF